MQQLLPERLICGVAATAAMERAVALTVEYTKSRNMFGQKLFDLQNTRFELAECASIARISRTFIDDCIVKYLRSEEHTSGTPVTNAQLVCRLLLAKNKT